MNNGSKGAVKMTAGRDLGTTSAVCVSSTQKERRSARGGKAARTTPKAL
jgi:hypothetical protein